MAHGVHTYRSFSEKMIGQEGSHLSFNTTIHTIKYMRYTNNSNTAYKNIRNYNQYST